MSAHTKAGTARKKAELQPSGTQWWQGRLALMRGVYQGTARAGGIAIRFSFPNEQLHALIRVRRAGPGKGTASSVPRGSRITMEPAVNPLTDSLIGAIQFASSIVVVREVRWMCNPGRGVDTAAETTPYYPAHVDMWRMWIPHLPHRGPRSIGQRMTVGCLRRS